MTAPYPAGYTGLIRVSSPHPQSYRPDLPRRDAPLNWHNTAEEMQAYCRVHGIAKSGPWLCKAIKGPSGNPVWGSPTLTLAGQQEAF